MDSTVQADMFLEVQDLNLLSIQSSNTGSW